MQPRVVVSGLGFISSIGNSTPEVSSSLRHLRSGIETFPEFQRPGSPVSVAGTLKGFSFPSADVEDWTIPAPYRIPLANLRPMSPNAVFGYCALRQAIESAQLPPDLVSHPRTALYGASAGSAWLTFENLQVIDQLGASRASPACVPAGAVGTLNYNLSTCFKIKGGSLGFASACASSAHALGHAFDQILLGKFDRVFVVGAEDLSWHTALPFVGLRALSTSSDPHTASRPFDAGRNGFVPTGGGAALVLESLQAARARQAAPLAEVCGWAESSDGFNVVAPQPEGEGLERALRLALDCVRWKPQDVDYINAHATSTPLGDVAESKALTRVFGGSPQTRVSSTKALTGHGLSLAGALEAGITCLALHEGFYPVSANITTPEPACAPVNIITAPVDGAPRTALSNSSGFGGSNVVLAFRRWEA